MSDKSKIEWTDSTWNPIRGCSLVSAGCANCYAMRQAHRLKPYKGLTRMTKHGPVWTGEIHELDEQLYKPLFWERPRKIFPTSMSDLFHPSVSDSFLARVFAIMALARHHIFQGTTKRAERQREFVDHKSALVFEAFTILRKDSEQQTDINDRGDRLPLHYADIIWPGWPLPNFWAGVSVEDQTTAEERIPLLLQTSAAVRWISYEPALGPLDLTRIDYTNRLKAILKVACERDNLPDESAIYKPGSARIDALNGEWFDGWDRGPGKKLDWIVCGGESGPHARPMHPAWVRSIRDQCHAAGVPFFFKQWGEWRIGESRDFGNYRMEEVRRDGDSNKDKQLMSRVGKKAAGAMLDGWEWREMPR